MRSVSLTHGQNGEFDVVLAQTRLSRDRMLQRLLVYSIAPQVLLLVLLALWLRRALQTDLEPLARLQRRLTGDPHMISPLFRQRPAPGICSAWPKP